LSAAGETVSLDGKHYQVQDAMNFPAPISDIPIMIGGSGEKKTLRMVAQYANESNLGGATVAGGFPALTASPQSVLGCLAALWEIGPFDSVERRPVNASARARSRLLSAPVSLASAVLRRLGMRRLVQRVKDKPSVMGFFFVPLGEPERGALDLSEGSRQILSRSFAECQSIIERSSEQIAEGVYFAGVSA